MRTRKLLFMVLPIVLCFILFLACKKNSEETSQLSIRMTDAPFNAKEVNVDVKEVRVKFASDTLSWFHLTPTQKFIIY